MSDSIGSLLVATAICGTLAPSPAVAQTKAIDIRSQDAAQGIAALARQADVQILISAQDAHGKRVNAVRGSYSVTEAIGRMLAGTGLAARSTGPQTWVIVAQAPGGNGVGSTDASLDATPEILVQGRREWSLNLGIERTENDSQPFVVLTSEDIKRSGAPDLETFLRNQLSVNNSAGTATQAGAIGPQGLANRSTQGLSQLNLRGFGSRETLILVDGRRQPGVNLGNGTLGQAQITGIPLASIERIEVLASSASSIYGSGASGGAINIILKHNYSGGEITATYANTDDFKAGDGRIDLSLAKTLEGGRTNVTFAGSWRKALPLLYRDRIDIRNDNVAETIRLTGQIPFSTAGLPPPGATPNFIGAGGRPLQLKPRYGGTLLPSAIGYIPEGYRGLAQDGIAPLLATIGNYNLEAPGGTSYGGLDSPLIYGSELLSGLLTARRKMTDWMTLYVQGQASQSKSQTYFSRGLSIFTLAANAPNNPFTSSVTVAGPNVGELATLDNTYTQWSALGGAIFRLPYEWQANLDASYSRTRFTIPDYPTTLSQATRTAIANGTLNLFRDYADSPPSLQYAPNFTQRNAPQLSSTLTTSLRLAGPLPIKLPGGKVGVTFNLERSRDTLDEARFVNEFLGSYLLNYRPEGRYTLSSIYSEIVLPFISPENGIPFVKLFDIRVSARGERYTAIGSDQSTQCYDGTTPPNAEAYAACPPVGYDDRSGRSTRSHIDPMVSFRWQPVDDVLFRASYGTGYLPPTLAQISKRVAPLGVVLFDPQRNFEPIGAVGPRGNYLVNGASGGNPDVKPEESKTLTAGIIFTPRFIRNLRFSADWTRITKRNNFFDPFSSFALAGLSYKGTLEGPLLDFSRFLEANPDRVQRGPASGGFSVGPITSLDLSLANYVGSRVEAVDFALDYWFDLFGGRLDVQAAATWNRKLEIESYPGRVTDYLGVSNLTLAGGNFGSLPWRGNGTVRWSKDGFSAGFQSIFFDRYYLLTDRKVVAAQGSAYVAAQMYHNLNFAYVYDNGITLRLNINNVFDKIPPRDVTSNPFFYSRYGNPRGRNFQLSVTKAF